MGTIKGVSLSGSILQSGNVTGTTTTEGNVEGSVQDAQNLQGYTATTEIVKGSVSSESGVQGNVLVQQATQGRLTIGTAVRGLSPTIAVEEIEGGHRIYIVDINGTQVFDMLDGVDGQDGTNGADGQSIIHEWDGTVLSITSASGTTSMNLKGDPGVDGKDGIDGVDGQPGKDGIDGVDGKDAVSPVVSVTNTETGYLVTITDVNGSQSFEILNGVDGSDGKAGEDAVSPVVSVTETVSGHTITIDDVNGSQSFEILNGVDGADGKDGADGATGQDGYTPVKGVDYFTEEDIAQIISDTSKLVTVDHVIPEQVVFPNGAVTTYAIGNVSLVNGMGTLVEPGGTLADFFNNFVKEINPTTTQPSVSLTVGVAGAYEVGTYTTPTFAAVLNPGNYTYGPDTGIVAKSWTISDTAGRTAAAATGRFAQLQVGDSTSYKITATATYESGTIPVTNTGNEYASGQILAGSVSTTSSAVTGYRRSFYGTLNNKNEITSDAIRGLSGYSTTALKNGDSFTISIPVGALRVVFAYPATLRDVTEIRDVNGMNANITSSFTQQTLNVEGANSYKEISYKVYTLDFANANDTANKFTVVI